MIIVRCSSNLFASPRKASIQFLTGEVRIPYDLKALTARFRRKDRIELLRKNAARDQGRPGRDCSIPVHSPSPCRQRSQEILGLLA
jgi:hypothetical protein